MDLHDHHFRNFKSVEKICRCGFVIPRDATAEQIEDLMRENLGYVAKCGGRWHVYPPLYGAEEQST